MKTRLLSAILAAFSLSTVSAQSLCHYSFSANFNTLSFVNQSTLGNAHYFWNFGDGTGSNLQHPAHRFPASGTYLVTLFAKDTTGSAADYYEEWIDVTEYSTDSCRPSITDSILHDGSRDCLKITDNSPGCAGIRSNIDAGPAFNASAYNCIWLDGGWERARFLSRVQYYDAAHQYLPLEAYRTSPYRYTSSKNYGDCSANFEIAVASEDSFGQRILFSAMNKKAAYYQWEIVGFGNAIYSANDTISHRYSFDPSITWLVGLTTVDSSGCRDRLYQTILSKKEVRTTENFPAVLGPAPQPLYPNPFTQRAFLKIPAGLQESVFSLYNGNGRLVRLVRDIAPGTELVIEREELPAGFYYYTLQSGGVVKAKGKVVLR